MNHCDLRTELFHWSVAMDRLQRLLQLGREALEKVPYNAETEDGFDSTDAAIAGAGALLRELSERMAEVESIVLTRQAPAKRGDSAATAPREATIRWLDEEGCDAARA